MQYLLLILFVTTAQSGPATENYKDQYCTDPRTGQKHSAYTEWADAYSCTRHRCQPGGRNLAIYTVGCKRVEAPESAIECEEVVEDTNMQFPFCCTRLRCLVVVRGEVWTRVLGQPWETLPAAPWSHMYKMKKPPPGDDNFGAPKIAQQGPVYELAVSENDGNRDRVRSTKDSTDSPVYNEPRDQSRRASPHHTPDIVIALSTDPEPKINIHDKLGTRHKRVHKESHRVKDLNSEDRELMETEGDIEDAIPTTEQSQSQNQQSWTESPPNWNERDPVIEADNNMDNPYNQDDLEKSVEEKPSNLQALVDAIGNRMRDIENVVQRMSAKVQSPPVDEPGTLGREEAIEDIDRSQNKERRKLKRPAHDKEHYKRFSVRNRSKYLHRDASTDIPLYIEDGSPSGYFSDASNAVLQRPKGSKESIATYMAPVDTRRKPHQQDTSDEKKKKKHLHKKKKSKHHKKHQHKRNFNHLSVEEKKTQNSIEDSNEAGALSK